MKLSQLKQNQNAVITAILTTDRFKERLNKMGLRVGEMITLTKVAPFLSPVQIRINNSYLAIRKSDAERIEVALK